MTDKLIMAGAAGFVLIVVVALAVWILRRRRPIKIDYFQKEWKNLQGLLRNKERWDVALLQADNLLDIALKRKRVRGHNMGERLVKAQRMFSDNDGVWFGHKLRNKIESDPKAKLKESDLKQALIGIRQALKDLGALPDAKKN